MVESIKLFIQSETSNFEKQTANDEDEIDEKQNLLITKESVKFNFNKSIFSGSHYSAYILQLAIANASRDFFFNRYKQSLDKSR